MNDYISREAVINITAETGAWETQNRVRKLPSADVQEKRYCRMIPLEPDCRGYTDLFICTNCHQHIHLGAIQKEYSGSFCLECGAEVTDGDTNG